MNENDMLMTTRVRLRQKNQGENSARGNGNPYDWNTPEWRIWNDGYLRGSARTAARMVARNERMR